MANLIAGRFPSLLDLSLLNLKEKFPDIVKIGKEREDLINAFPGMENMIKSSSNNGYDKDAIITEIKKRISKLSSIIAEQRGLDQNVVELAITKKIQTPTFKQNFLRDLEANRRFFVSIGPGAVADIGVQIDTLRRKERAKEIGNLRAIGEMASGFVAGFKDTFLDPFTSFKHAPLTTFLVWVPFLRGGIKRIPKVKNVFKTAEKQGWINLTSRARKELASPNLAEPKALPSPEIIHAQKIAELIKSGDIKIINETGIVDTPLANEFIKKLSTDIDASTRSVIDDVIKMLDEAPVVDNKLLNGIKSKLQYSGLSEKVIAELLNSIEEHSITRTSKVLLSSDLIFKGDFPVTDIAGLGRIRYLPEDFILEYPGNKMPTDLPLSEARKMKLQYEEWMRKHPLTTDVTRPESLLLPDVTTKAILNELAKNVKRILPGKRKGLDIFRSRKKFIEQMSAGLRLIGLEMDPTENLITKVGDYIVRSKADPRLFVRFQNKVELFRFVKKATEMFEIFIRKDDAFRPFVDSVGIDLMKKAISSEAPSEFLANFDPNTLEIIPRMKGEVKFINSKLADATAIQEIRMILSQIGQGIKISKMRLNLKIFFSDTMNQKIIDANILLYGKQNVIRGLLINKKKLINNLGYERYNKILDYVNDYESMKVRKLNPEERKYTDTSKGRAKEKAKTETQSHGTSIDSKTDNTITDDYSIKRVKSGEIKDPLGVVSGLFMIGRKKYAFWEGRSGGKFKFWTNIYQKVKAKELAMDRFVEPYRREAIKRFENYKQIERIRITDALELSGEDRIKFMAENEFTPKMIEDVQWLNENYNDLFKKLFLNKKYKNVAFKDIPLEVLRKAEYIEGYSPHRNILRKVLREFDVDELKGKADPKIIKEWEARLLRAGAMTIYQKDALQLFLSYLHKGSREFFLKDVILKSHEELNSIIALTEKEGVTNAWQIPIRSTIEFLKHYVSAGPDGLTQHRAFLKSINSTFKLGLDNAQIDDVMTFFNESLYYGFMSWRGLPVMKQWLQSITTAVPVVGFKWWRKALKEAIKDRGKFLKYGHGKGWTRESFLRFVPAESEMRTRILDGFEQVKNPETGYIELVPKKDSLFTIKKLNDGSYEISGLGYPVKINADGSIVAKTPNGTVSEIIGSFTGKTLLNYIKVSRKIGQKGLGAFKTGDSFNLTMMGRAVEMKWEHFLDLLEKGKIDKKKFFHEMELDVLDDPIASRYERLLKEGKMEQLKEEVIAQNLYDANWLYTTENKIGLFGDMSPMKSFYAKMLGSFGTWSASYGNMLGSFIRINTRELGRKPFFESSNFTRAKRLSRFLMAHYAIKKAGDELGIDTSSWIFGGPLMYGFGPQYAIVNAFRDLLAGTEYNKRFAFNQIKHLLPKLVGAPTGPYDDISKAFEEGDAKRALGLRPKEEELFSF